MKNDDIAVIINGMTGISLDLHKRLANESGFYPVSGNYDHPGCRFSIKNIMEGNIEQFGNQNVALLDLREPLEDTAECEVIQYLANVCADFKIPMITCRDYKLMFCRSMQPFKT